jgi:hypothetical protein
MYSIELGSPIDSEALRRELPEGVQIQDEGRQYSEYDATGFSLFVFTVTWAAGIPAGVIANRIYDAMKKRSKEPPTRILIEKRIVEFDRGAVTRVIEERVRIQESSASNTDAHKA